MGAEGGEVPPDGGGPVHERQRPQHGDAGVHHVHAAVVAHLHLGAAVADQSTCGENKEKCYVFCILVRQGFLWWLREWLF